jgi:phage-related protein
MDILDLQCQIGLSKTVDFKINRTILGDSYTQTRSLAENKSINYKLQTGFLTEQEVIDLLDLFAKYNSITTFKWLPTPSHTSPIICRCTNWDSTQISTSKFVVDANFEQVNVANCIELDFDIDVTTIAPKLLAAWQFIQTYTRDALPNFANSLGLPLNDFMSKSGRRNYFPKECGTTEALYLISNSVLELYERFNNSAMLAYALNTIETAIPILYKKPVPTNHNSGIWLPHWLYTGRGQAEIKGLTSAPNFLQSGYIGILATFNNGIANLPNTLANCYRAYNGEILWKYVYAPLISGDDFPIDYYINKYNQKVNEFGDELTNDTGLTPGQVKLKSNHTGQLKVIYSLFTGNFVPNNSTIEAFPMWRATLTGDDLEINHAFDVSFWANETYGLLKRFNGSQADKWQRAIDANIYSTLAASNVVNESFVFKIDTTTNDPTSYVGVQLILINGKIATLSREPNGWYRITQNSSPANLYGQCELQNFAIYAIWTRQTYWSCNFTINTNAILYFGVSTSSNTGDTSQMYYAPYICNVNQTYSKNFTNLNFLKWVKTNWHSTNADNAISTYQGNGGSAIANQEMQTIDGQERLVAKLTLNNNSGFAGGVLGLLENQPRLPLNMYCAISGNIIIKITDGSGNIFYDELFPQTWGALQINVSSLKRFNNHTDDFNQNDPITQVEFYSGGSGQISLWYIGRPPQSLPYNSYVFKHLISCRIPDAAIWKIGDCKVENSPLNDLPYNPAVVPFTANYVGTTRVSWTGSPYVGYQDESFYYKIGRNDLAQEVVNFKLASQNSYAANSASGANWVFRQVFNWARWDSASPPPYNVFLDVGADPNVQWEGYQHRAIECTAEYWYLSGNAIAGQVTMRFLRGLYFWFSQRLLANLPIQPPTDYPPPGTGLPTSLYHTPHGAALILRTAIYANLAGGEPFVTCQIILWMWQYLESQYLSSGVMQGSWSSGQPSFSVNGTSYKEYFPFWHGEIILALLLLEEKYSELNLPIC